MKSKRIWMISAITGLVAVVRGWTFAAQDKQDKYTLSVPGGLAFSDFKGIRRLAGCWPEFG